MTKEIWKWVPGYEPLYEISDQGNLRSRYNTGHISNILRKTPKLLKGGNLPDGRKFYTLIKNGQKKYKYAHQIVMLAFVGPRPEGKEVCHNNGKNTDNRLKNLRYATHKENIEDKKKHGTHQVGENTSGAKLREDQVVEIFSKKHKNSSKSLGVKYNVSHKTIEDIFYGVTWTHVTKRKLHG